MFLRRFDVDFYELWQRMAVNVESRGRRRKKSRAHVDWDLLTSRVSRLEIASLRETLKREMTAAKKVCGKENSCSYFFDCYLFQEFPFIIFFSQNELCFFIIIFIIFIISIKINSHPTNNKNKRMFVTNEWTNEMLSQQNKRKSFNKRGKFLISRLCLPILDKKSRETFTPMDFWLIVFLPLGQRCKKLPMIKW